MIQEWVNEGKTESINQIAEKMLKANYPIKDIASITDLSVDEVNDIAAKLQL